MREYVYVYGDDLTMGRCLSTLYRLSGGQHGTMAEWYATYWRSYHLARGGGEYPVIPDPSQTSKLMRDCCRCPRRMYIHYTRHDDLLRQDVRMYVAQTVVTARQRIEHMEALAEMWEGSVNLEDDDVAYIRGYTAAAEEDQLTELIYRMMVVLLRESVARAA